MAVSSWAVRDFSLISREAELKVRLEQARTDFRAMLTDIVYFNRSSENPNEFDDEYILTNQAITFVYVNQATAMACAFNRFLPSSSSNCGAVATQIPPWLLSSQQLNHILQERLRSRRAGQLLQRPTGKYFLFGNFYELSFCAIRNRTH
ncbi:MULTISPECIES: RolB family protein [unclassified Rhizobium]|uniref:RolB family protein n=1 Tax=unclassified Rhizobium TaxID=2613769 RepID=UPI00214C43F0|nr:MULTISPECIES: RolB family protein [unclassified Rhizobium]